MKNEPIKPRKTGRIECTPDPQALVRPAAQSSSSWDLPENRGMGGRRRFAGRTPPRREFENVGVSLSIRLVAAASLCLEAGSIEHRRFATVVFDVASTLQLARGPGDADAANTEHGGEKSVRDAKGVGISPAPAHQQPSGQARTDLMEPKARCRRGQLQHQHIGVAAEFVANTEEHAAGLTTVIPFLDRGHALRGGGRYSKGPDWQSHVVVEGPLITEQNPASSEPAGPGDTRSPPAGCHRSMSCPRVHTGPRSIVELVGDRTDGRREYRQASRHASAFD